MIAILNDNIVVHTTDTLLGKPRQKQSNSTTRVTMQLLIDKEGEVLYITTRVQLKMGLRQLKLLKCLWRIFPNIQCRSSANEHTQKRNTNNILSPIWAPK